MQVCLGHLKSAGVDLTAIDAEGKRLPVNVSAKKQKQANFNKAV